MAVTCAPSSTPLSASSVIVAGWPTFTLLMSDSLKATVIVMVLLFTISANAELEPLDEPVLLDEPEPPRLPAADDPPELGEELEEELPVELLEADEEDPADT